MIFETPILALALLLLPVLWLLFRLRPPAPKKIVFPAVSLIKPANEQLAKASPPWWLTLLRMFCAALLILGCAGPVYKPLPAADTAGDMLIIIDNGWSAASHWNELKTAALDALRERHTREGRIYVAFTAPPFASAEPFTPALARAAIERMTAQPWPSQREKLIAHLPDHITHTLWISDGIEDGGSQSLATALQHRASLQVILPAKTAPMILKNAVPNADGFVVTLARSVLPIAQQVGVSIISNDGTIIAHNDTVFPSGSTVIHETLPLPPGTRNIASRIVIDGETSAAAVSLLGSSARRSYVGIVSADAASEQQPLKAMDYYLKRALEPHADIKFATLGAALNAGINVLMLADIGQLPKDDNDKLAQWLDKGGLAVLFAGPRLAEAGTAFAPVKLRAASRILGGSMSWLKPLSFGTWPTQSPFVDIKIPDDVTVREQVLTDPSADLVGHVWATLSDGTPIVTAAQHGHGLVVLFHTTANAAWSNLALSGLFENMVQKLLTLAQANASAFSAPPRDANFTLTQSLLYDGTLVPATSIGAPLQADVLAHINPGPAHPPGLYTSGTNSQALNLGESLAVPTAIKWPRNSVLNKDQQTATYLMPWLVFLASLLLLLDWLIVVALQGHFKRIMRLLPALGAFFGLSHAQAAAVPVGALDVRLAYVATSGSTNSASGLSKLGEALKARTAADVGTPVPVDPDRVSLGLYAVVYWPVTANPVPLSTSATRHILSYLESGGLIVFDTAGQGSAELRQLLLPLDLPRLEPLRPEHVLAHSFYLLGNVPGGFDFSSQWVESGTLGASGRTTSVVLSVGGNWATAWANGNEAALRYGVNLVIYALSGTYKADQVHAASLLERMGKTRTPQ